MRRVAVLVCLFASHACGPAAEEDEPASTPPPRTVEDGCSFAADLQGELAVQMRHDDSHGCAGSGSGQRLSLTWGTGRNPDTAQDLRVDLETLEPVPAGETVSQVDATLTITDRAVEPPRVWSTAAGACTIELERNEEDADVEGLWNLAGVGRCDEAAFAEDSTSVTIETFTFGGVAAWQ